MIISRAVAIREQVGHRGFSHRAHRDHRDKKKETAVVKK